jgi:hypothetical protein
MRQSASVRNARRAFWERRPDPCLELELLEYFSGRDVPLRWRQDPRLPQLVDQPVVRLGRGGRRLELAFFEDAVELVFAWIAFWSGYDLAVVHDAFRVEILQLPEEAIEVRADPDDPNSSFILLSLMDAGASLRPTIH